MSETNKRKSDTISGNLPIDAKELERRVAQQLAAAIHSKQLVTSNDSLTRKAVYHTLRLNEKGQEIDEHGKVVEHDLSKIKTVAANTSYEQANKKMKKENPYLSHLTSKQEDTNSAVYDDRLLLRDRFSRARKAFQFVEAGTYVQQEEDDRIRFEKRMLSGAVSGRKRILKKKQKELKEQATGADEIVLPEAEEDNEEGSDEDNHSLESEISSDNEIIIPGPSDSGVVPAMEWWDELFLPKDIREGRKKSVAASSADDYEHVAIVNIKTYKFIQHPVCIKAIGGEKQITVVPMFLTKKEKRKIRKSKRAAAEKEKLDKIMMGLLPTPEPKFKLSNFMKILGDQAVLDPSKVELKVLEQIKQRQIAHEVRNEAAKLTPHERATKQTKKLTEDTSRQVHVALFKIKDFSNTKNSWKVDINAQQYQLSGLVLLCDEKNVPTVVIVEGGPKAITKFTKLMLKRIKWNATNDEIEVEDNESSDDDEDGNDAGRREKTTEIVGNNFCRLLWNGVVAKRTFTGFKFQECKSKIVIRKVLEAKNVPHYWDIVANSKEFDDLL